MYYIRFSTFPTSFLQTDGWYISFSSISKLHDKKSDKCDNIIVLTRDNIVVLTEGSTAVRQSSKDQHALCMESGHKYEGTNHFQVSSLFSFIFGLFLIEVILLLIVNSDFKFSLPNDVSCTWNYFLAQ